ncbi:hypothetical protein [Allofrancisella frigidaquae]|nr:hypothetical protein [Allofrancisella frigidaquae]
MYSFIGAKEPIYFAVVYLAVCLGLSKIFVMSLANGLLAIFSYTYLKYKGHYKIYGFLIVTFSFYFLVLYTGAERLKFGFLFGILSLLLYNRAKIKLSYLCVLLSVLSHFSMILFYIPIFLYMRSNFKLTNKETIVFCIIMMISLFVFVLFESIILHKFSAYIYKTTISDILKSLVVGLIFICFYKGNYRVRVIAISTFYILATVLLGNRAFMFEVFFLLYLMLPKKDMEMKRYSLVLFLLISFLLIKGIFFIDNVIEYGDGFWVIK